MKNAIIALVLLVPSASFAQETDCSQFGVGAPAFDISQREGEIISCEPLTVRWKDGSKEAVTEFYPSLDSLPEDAKNPNYEDPAIFED